MVLVPFNITLDHTLKEKIKKMYPNKSSEIIRKLLLEHIDKVEKKRIKEDKSLTKKEKMRALFDKAESK